ncbi:Chromodomain-helicase-DNA-binding protein 6 [Porphyridium purpureum]|uniref:Chromodomain-helicase-DNA-binding protein 6 n=1 Tax=Porphyridium purpureum TaxID=35688 RepID=A0A5J4Z1Y1_PORPP|nr:Chromodomain-helicase-DNA-binding protein 6 [Porphyridium purpureum]|eukprot:POR6004..scf295_1
MQDASARHEHHAHNNMTGSGMNDESGHERVPNPGRDEGHAPNGDASGATHKRARVQAADVQRVADHASAPAGSRPDGRHTTELQEVKVDGHAAEEGTAPQSRARARVALKDATKNRAKPAHLTRKRGRTIDAPPSVLQRDSIFLFVTDLGFQQGTSLWSEYKRSGLSDTTFGGPTDWNVAPSEAQVSETLARATRHPMFQKIAAGHPDRHFYRPNTQQLANAKVGCLAKIIGALYEPENCASPVYFELAIRKLRVVLGRSSMLPEGASTDQRATWTPFDHVDQILDLGIGLTNRLSRQHVEIFYEPRAQCWMTRCLGRNPILVAGPLEKPCKVVLAQEQDSKRGDDGSDDEKERAISVRILAAGEQEPAALQSGSYILAGSCLLIFQEPVPSENMESEGLMYLQSLSGSLQAQDIGASHRGDATEGSGSAAAEVAAALLEVHHAKDEFREPVVHDGQHSRNLLQPVRHSKQAAEKERNAKGAFVSQKDKVARQTELERFNHLSPAELYAFMQQFRDDGPGEALRSFVLKFGYGRWDMVRAHIPRRASESANANGTHPPTRSELEMTLMFWPTLCQCMVAVDKHERESQHSWYGGEREVLEKWMKGSLPANWSRTERRHFMKAELQSAAQTMSSEDVAFGILWAKQLCFLSGVNSVVKHPGILNRIREKPAILIALPAPWWDAQCDADALVGIFRHGYGSYVEIRNDPELCFSRRCGPVTRKANAGEGSSDQNEHESSKNTNAVSEDESQTQGRIGPVPDFSAVVSRLVVVMQAFCYITGEGDTHETTATKKEGQVELRGSSESLVHDSVDGHGLDPLGPLSPNKKEDKAPLTAKEFVEFEEYLTQFGIKSISGASRQAEGEQADSECVRDWLWFKTKVSGNLKTKSPETLEHAYRALIAECERVMESNADGAAIDAAAADTGKAGTDNDKILDESGAQTLSAALAADASGQKLLITAERAYKLLERLDFFRLLRAEILPCRALSSIIGNMKKGKDLPYWWKTHHDIALLQGVDRHGLDDWHAIENDDPIFAHAQQDYRDKNAFDTSGEERRISFPRPNIGVRRAITLALHFGKNKDSA